METFKKGTYIVLLKSCDGLNCWENSIPENYVYKLNKNSTIDDYQFEKDIISGMNGWSISINYDNKTEFRYATNREIHEYDLYNKPCLAITYDIYNDDKNNHKNLIKLLKQYKLV